MWSKCVRRMGSSLTIFFSIVRFLAPYGMLFPATLGYLRLCLDEWLICLLAGGTAGSNWSAVVWKMLPSCLLWCIWKERKDRSFEDHERTLEELISFFFYTLYIWIAAFDSPFVLNFHDFFVLFSPPS
jgi:hypothetical protein